jgi:hypothetical protein
MKSERKLIDLYKELYEIDIDSDQSKIKSHIKKTFSLLRKLK